MGVLSVTTAESACEALESEFADGDVPSCFGCRASWYRESYERPRHHIGEESSFLGRGSQKYWTTFLLKRAKSF